MLITVGFFALTAVFAPIAMSRMMKMPAELQWEDLGQGSISAAGKTALDEVEREATQLNFTPVKTCRLINFGPKFENQLLYCADSGVVLVAMFTDSMGVKVTGLELTTRFEDGQKLQTTGRKEMKSSFSPVTQIASSLTGVANVAELCKRHLQRVEAKKASGVGARYLQPDRIMDELAQDHARELEERVRRGIWKFDPQANCYRIAPFGIMKNYRSIFSGRSTSDSLPRLRGEIFTAG